MYTNPWRFNGEVFLSEHIGDNYGFVYLLEDVQNGKQYIGRKYFWTFQKRNGKKKEKRESNWKDYYSSSHIINELIQKDGPERFTRTILQIHKTKAEVNYHEVKLQFKMDVLETLLENRERKFYNESINCRYFVPKSLHYVKTEEHKEKISKRLKELGIKPKTCTDPRTIDQILASKHSMQKIHLDGKNPNKSNKFVYMVQFEEGIIEIHDLKKWCLERDIKYVALRTWSKYQNRRLFNGKIKQSKLHPKYHMKILSWKNIITGKEGSFE